MSEHHETNLANLRAAVTDLNHEHRSWLDQIKVRIVTASGEVIHDLRTAILHITESL